MSHYRPPAAASREQDFPIFNFFENVPRTNRHGDFFRCLMKASARQPVPRLQPFVVALLLLAVFPTMYVATARKEFYEALG